MNKIVAFPCGHCLCIDCKDRLFKESTRAKCPRCDIDVYNQDGTHDHPPSQVFLELFDEILLKLRELREVQDSQGPQPQQNMPSSSSNTSLRQYLQKPSVYCAVCFSNLPMDKFIVFPCGHGFCIECKERMFQQSTRVKCPNCRIPVRDQDSHPVFLELVDYYEILQKLQRYREVLQGLQLELNRANNVRTRFETLSSMTSFFYYMLFILMTALLFIALLFILTPIIGSKFGFGCDTV
ncbi:hypothetical protein BYT27DRAFT_7179431 [Phlegmacium glaucopus]|nr:hypothetical protein BYT27DRAFT_7179431 [Phlegmacium glaucopus]